MAEVQPATIAVMEQALLDRLKVKVSKLAVEPFPDRPESYRMMHQVGVLLVSYRGAEYSALEDTGDVAQRREMSFDLHLVVRGLSGTHGAYPYLEAARLAVTGLKVPGFRKVVPLRERFISQKEGVWTFALTVQTSTIAAELDEATVGALLARLTMTSDYTTSEVPGG